MNPAATLPTAPNLVTCLMADRMAEAAELRQAAEIGSTGTLAAESESPHRFRRFLTNGLRREARTTPIAQGH